MSSGLVFLLLQRPVARYRLIRRRLRGPRGIAVFTLAVLFLLAVVAGQMVLAPEAGSARARELAAWSETWVPPALILLFVLTVSTGEALYFRPSEIDFLFSAPVSRRQLLAYHVVSRLEVALLSSAWLAVFLVPHAPLWYAGFLGILSSLVFLQLAAQVVALVLGSISRVTRMRARPILTALAVGAAGWGVVFLATGRTGGGFGAALVSFFGGTGARIAATPFLVFVDLFFAASPTETVRWTLTAGVMLLATFGAILMLDVAFAEQAVHASRRIQQRLERMRTGGGSMAGLGTIRTRLALPQPPRLMGVGPLVWRQFLVLGRNVRGFLVVLAASAGMTLIFVALSTGSPVGRVPMVALPSVLVLLTLIMTQYLTFDFRRDLDRMGYLKSLPLPPLVLAAGQIAPTALVFTVLQMAAIAVLAFLAGAPSPGLLVAVVMLLLPLNWAIACIDNALFLMMPHRLAPKAAGDFQFMGRVMATMLLKIILVTALTVAGAALGWRLFVIADAPPVVAGAAVSALLVAFCIPLTWLVAHLFRIFDVTCDI